MSDMMYFVSNWTISRDDILEGIFLQLMDICTNNQCILYLTSPKYSEDRYSFIELIACIPQGIDFPSLAKEASQQLRLTEWREVSKEYCQIIAIIPSLQEVPPSGRVLEGLWRIGFQNEHRQKNSSEQQIGDES